MHRSIAAALVGIVIGIADGDTLAARCGAREGRMKIDVRLAEIDAREWG